ncbi:hypothetical protein ACR79B_20505 [Sphingobacterium spiritivorum]|uniref:hypothetical protein n=1 Tax=Sphingobacterium spiritivorum TaxID=258 RepID=UPI003DA38F10
MKKIILLICIVSLIGCKKKNDCYYNGKPLKVGEKGGCYYVTEKGNKEYVDRSACNCE